MGTKIPLHLHNKDDQRIRRRILHHITRFLGQGDPNRLEAFEKYYKSLVHEAITVVLVTERMAKEKVE